jgi:hypothetical protein
MIHQGLQDTDHKAVFLYAELTGIPTSSMYVLTGSGISGTRGSEPGDQSGLTN